jgi:hypothetical protein
MTTLTFAVRDSATMTRRSFRHLLRYPATLITSVGVPVLMLPRARSHPKKPSTDKPSARSAAEQLL